MVRLLYLVNPTILIYNLDVLENAILFVLLGLGLKVIVCTNLMVQASRV